ncbi:tetratricopeptide repeat protein [Richelia intracellularis]|nr:hypothetical protein [Richelia intracellularis]
MRVPLVLLLVLLFVNPVIHAKKAITARDKTIDLKISNTSSTHKYNRQISTLVNDLENLDRCLTIIIFFISKLLAVIFTIVVLRRVMLLILNRPPQLVIDNFSNATGATSLDDVLHGLSQLARQRLIKEIKDVHQGIKHHIIDIGLDILHSVDKLPLPQTTPDKRITNLINSLQKFTPDNIDQAVQLLNIMFPPQGTKVSSILQSQGDEHHILGITFEISDIQGNIASKLYTVWEDEKCQSSYQGLKDRYRELLKPAIRWLAIELSRREIIAGGSQFNSSSQRQAYQAKVYNFFGVFSQNSGQSHGGLFYKLAIEDLQDAILVDPNWYQPYENLAETYALIAGQEKGEESVYLYNQAVTNYNLAIALFANRDVGVTGR